MDIVGTLKIRLAEYQSVLSRNQNNNNNDNNNNNVCTVGNWSTRTLVNSYPSLVIDTIQVIC